MPVANLRIRSADEPLGRASARGVTITVCGATPADDEWIVLCSISGDDVDAAVETLSSADSVHDLQVIRDSDGEQLVQLRVACVVFDVLETAGIAFEPPLVVDSEAAWIRVRTTEERLPALNEAFRSAGVEYELKRVRQELEPPGGLTERQDRVLAAAVEGGYFDSPRGCTVAEIADELDLAKSTVSETLQRAQRDLARAHLEKLE